MEKKIKLLKGRKVVFAKDTSPDTVTGVLKLFFTELSNPILTFELYQSFLSALSINYIFKITIFYNFFFNFFAFYFFIVLQDEILRLWCVRKVIDTLPPGNRLIVNRVCAMFRIITRLEEDNKMSAKNIAIVMSSCMFRDKNESAEQMLRTGGLRVRLLELLIRMHEEIFLVSFFF